MAMLDTGNKRKIVLASLAISAVQILGLFNLASIHPYAPMVLGALDAVSVYWLWKKEI